MNPAYAMTAAGKRLAAGKQTRARDAFIEHGAPYLDAIAAAVDQTEATAPDPATDGMAAVHAWKHALGLRPGDVIVEEIAGPGGVTHKIVVAEDAGYPQGHRSRDGVWRWAAVPGRLVPPAEHPDGGVVDRLNLHVYPDDDFRVRLRSGEVVDLDPEHHVAVVRPHWTGPDGREEPLVRVQGVKRPPLYPNAKPHPTVEAAQDYIDYLNRVNGTQVRLTKQAVALVDTLLHGDPADVDNSAVLGSQMQNTRDWFARRVGLPTGLRGPDFMRAYLGKLGVDPDEYAREKKRREQEEREAAEQAEKERRLANRVREWGPALVAWYDDPDRGYNVTPRMLSSMRSKQYRYKGDVIDPDVYAARLAKEGRRFVERDRTEYSKRTGERKVKRAYEAYDDEGGTFNDLTKTEYLFATWLRDHPEYLEHYP